jgi:hypothetical protein
MTDANTAQQIEQFLRSPVWWVTVILASFLVNILSNAVYAKLIEPRFSSFSARIRRRAERRAERHRRLVSLIRSGPEARLAFFFLESRRRQDGIYVLAFSILMMVNAIFISVRYDVGRIGEGMVIVLLCAGGFMLLGAVMIDRQADQVRDALSDAATPDSPSDAG